MPGGSISSEKESYLFPWFGRRWSVTVRSGQFGTGNLKESLSSRRISMRFILSYTRFFNLLPGQLPMDHSTNREPPYCTSAFGETTKVNCTSFISNFVIEARMIRHEGVSG